MISGETSSCSLQLGYAKRGYKMDSNFVSIFQKLLFYKPNHL